MGEVLAACDAAVAGLAAAEPELIVVVGGAAASAVYDGSAAGSLREYGVRYAVGTGEPVLPLSLTVGSWLLRRAGLVPPDGAARGAGARRAAVCGCARWRGPRRPRTACASAPRSRGRPPGWPCSRWATGRPGRPPACPGGRPGRGPLRRRGGGRARRGRPGAAGPARPRARRRADGRGPRGLAGAGRVGRRGTAARPPALRDRAARGQLPGGVLGSAAPSPARRAEHAPGAATLMPCRRQAQ